MAPDLEKKREPRRAAGAVAHFRISDGAGGMQLLQRCSGSIFGDYYLHGTSTSVAASISSSAVIGANLRNSSGTDSANHGPAASSRPQNNPIHTANTRSRVGQQQQQQQPQSQRIHHRNQTRIPLTSSLLNRATGGLRNSDEQIGTRSATSNTQDLCDNSNDSGLGFEERQQQHLNKAAAWNGGVGEEDTKRRKMDIKLESEDANFAFPEVVQGSQSEGKISTRNGIVGSTRTTNSVNGSVGRVVGVTRPRPHLGVLAKRPPAHQGPVTLTSQLSSVSRNGKTQLQIICQPEQQHRARYQTEGSRGAVKDRTGNGFPIVRLIGYDKPTSLQVFIGTDLGRVAPHMFYQACRVSGKNSTPCVERKVDGTIVIEVDMEPAKDMLVTCDCVGILKERNVDVEHRFPQEAGILQGRSKKKSTRCRMVFRTTITYDDGTNETLQVCSQPIVCTQPPGIPEICKKSLTSCPCTGGLELFILGKNFLKDTRVVFQLDSDNLSSSLEPHWECTVLPDKEFLQQTHLVCVVPAYRRQDLAPSETINIKLYAVSSGKTSEPHAFLYTATSAPPAPSVGKLDSAPGSLVTSNTETVLSSKLPATPHVVSGNIASNGLLSQTATAAANFLGSIQQPSSASATSVNPEVLKSDPSPPPVTAAPPVTPVMMWTSQSTSNQASPADVMMPPPSSMVANPLITRRSSSSLQLILPDNLKTEVLDENSESSLMGDNSMSGIPSTTHNTTSVGSSLDQLMNDNSRDSSQTSLIRNTVPTNGSPVQEALLGVVDLIRNQHPLSIVSQQSTFRGLHEQSQVKVLSPHHINKDTSPIMTSEASISGNLQSQGVVDLRMKHHQSEFNGIGNGNLGSFAATPADQPLPAQSGHSIEKYLNQIESTVPKKPDVQEANFVRASIIASNQQQAPNMLSARTTSVPLDELVNSAVDSHQIVSPLRPANSSPSAIINHVTSVVEHDSMNSPQQPTRTSPPIPVKTMLLEALMPTTNVSSLSVDSGTTVPTVPVQVQEGTADDSLLKSINAALMPTIQESPIVSAAAAVAVANVNSSVNVSSHNPLQVTSEVMPSVATAIQALAQQDPVVMQQQVQQVEQVVAQAQQQVEQVVAQAQQQAVQAVQQAQQQVVQQVVQHAQVVQQAVQKVQAVQQAPAAPAVQQAVQQATQEVVQQAVQQATHEVVQQVQAVQQAVQQAQAAQAMQQAVQQDIGSMLNQPAGFVAEASSALASGAAQEPSQQRLTTAAEQAINNVITNATQDIINNRPITTTTAHAIIATKNILNSVATQSAQLMNSAMEGILPKSPVAQQTIVEQVTSKSPSTGPMTMQTSSNRATVVSQQTPMQQNNEPQQQVQQAATGVVRKTETATNGMMTQDLITDHELLSYIDASCFDPQNGFLM